VPRTDLEDYSKLEPIPYMRLSRYDTVNGRLVRIKNRVHASINYIARLEDLREYLSRHVGIPMPKALYPEKAEQEEKGLAQLPQEILSPEPSLLHKHSSDPNKSIQTGIDPDHLMLLAAKGQAFTDGPKHNRSDNLAKAMKKAWKIFMKEHKESPTAFELWDWIPIGGSIQEKEPDTQTISWKSADGGEKTTSFKSFQNRYTSLKKKLTA